MEQLVWILLSELVLVLGATPRHSVSVTCTFSQDCVLPCASGYHEVIHWYKGGDIVHSFYESADQLGYQSEAFRGRTALFNDQISRGNQSLHLSGVRISDRGEYKCYTADKVNNREQFVTLNVQAPITSVEIKVENNTTSCSTSRLFPEPNISWFVGDRPELKFTLNKEPDEESLFSLSSTLVVPFLPSTNYTCSVSLQDPSQAYNASIRKEVVEVHPGQNATLRCPLPAGDVEPYRLSLRHDSGDVLTYAGHASVPPNASRTWRDAEVLLLEGGVNVSQVDERHGGTYTCERLTGRSRQVVQTEMRIKPDSRIITVAITVVTVLVVVAGCITAGIMIKNKVCSQKKKESPEEKQLNTPKENRTVD